MIVAWRWRRNAAARGLNSGRRIHGRPFQMVRPSGGPSRDTSAKPILSQNRTAPTLARLIPTCVAFPPYLPAAVSHRSTSCEPTPRPRRRGRMFKRKNVQMEMRGILQGNSRRRMRRAMDHDNPSLIMCPSFSIDLRRNGVLPAQRRPPKPFELLFPRHRVDRANYKPGDALLIFDDKGQLRFEPGIGSGIDVPHQPKAR